MSARPKLVGDAEWVDPLLAFGRQPAPVIGRQEDCDICGQVERGCFGFGISRTRRGIWACQDIDCRAEAADRARGTTTTLIAAE